MRVAACIGSGLLVGTVAGIVADSMWRRMRLSPWRVDGVSRHPALRAAAALARSTPIRLTLERSGRMLPVEWHERATSLLKIAAVDGTDERLLELRVLAGVITAVAVVIIGLVLGWNPVVGLLFSLCSAGFGSLVPVLVLVRRADQRGRRVALQLPDFTGLLTCCCEAGMTVVQGLELVAVHLSGALGEELREALARSTAAGGIPVALRDLARRVNQPPVTAVMTSIVHADTIGMPLAPVLRQHARMLAATRRHLVSTRIATAGTLLTLCTVCLMLPATLAAVIVPNVVGLLQSGW